ncbi:MAG: phosphotransferase enzyme family protein [Candidatus Scatosoma sp.]
MNDETIERLCRIFGIEGEYRSYEQITSGHINKTYKVYFFCCGEVKDYILQKVNTFVFKNPVDVMNNIISVTEHIRNKIKETGASAKRRVLHYQKTDEGKYYYFDEDGAFWRCSRFIDDSCTFLIGSPFVMEESGKAFGEFQKHLADYPVKDLFIAIPHFHNTIMRFDAFKTAVKNDAYSRAAAVKEEIEGYLALEEEASKTYKRQRAGELPLRVTHNDTKCSNVLFDRKTQEHLSVIDLDTVMPGLVAFDFGDAIRAGANAAAEDEKDLSLVALDFKKFEAFTRGFLGVDKDALTPAEKDSLAGGAVAMTAECGVRFLTDYLEGDKYFSTDYAGHNLVRARCQLALANDMLKNFEKMKKIVRKYAD